MTASSTFTFSPNFTLRPAGDDDRQLAEQWTQADPEHAGVVDPGFWLQQDVGQDSYILLDKEGAIFFWKGILKCLDPAGKLGVEMHMQFPPEGGTYHSIGAANLRARIRIGMVLGLHWLEQMLKRANVAEVYFESKNLNLIFFCKKHLGFIRDGDGRLIKHLLPAGTERENVRVN
jgi:hypothetical protein